ncbi:MAG: glycosyltransferase family 2 protein [Bacteroidales bacterium]
MSQLVTIIVPCYNEERYIDSLCRDIINQDYGRENLEVLLIDGQSEDRTREIISEWTKNHENIRLLDNPQRFVPYALNRGIRESKARVIVRMDAHARYPSNYVSRLVEVLLTTPADNTGGIWETLPSRKGIIPLAIARAISSRFGIGNALYRLKVEKLTEVDTVPFGCYKRDVFDRIGYFDEELVRNQDDEFNARLKQNGGSIILVPDVKITYFARDSVAKIMKMFFQYGFFKPLVNRKIMRPASLRQFVPPVFVFCMASLLLLSLFYKIFMFVFLALLLIHLSFGILFSISDTLSTKKYLLLVLMPCVFLLIHLSYGYGYLKGICRFMIFKRNISGIETSR